MDFKTLISIDQKTGFKLIGSKVAEIYDFEKKPFYFFQPQNGNFNLPKGKYYTNNIVSRLQKPLNYKLLKLPKKNRNDLKNVFLTVKKNEATASILLHSGEIIVDKDKFFNFGKMQKDSIFLHEIGHFFYDSEENADLFAANEMLKMGYNPSQLITSRASTLRDTELNEKRCFSLLDKVVRNG